MRLGRNESKRLAALGAVIIAVFGGFDPSISAQEAIVIDDSDPCTTCSIELQKIATLGRPDDLIQPLYGARVAHDSKGQFYLSSTTRPGVIAAYDDRGTFIRAIGRLGQGPGEFGRRITHLLVGGDDAVHVFERQRHTVLESGTYEVRSLSNLPAAPGASVLAATEGLLVQMRLGADTGFALVHHLGASGVLLRSFVIVPSLDDPWERYRRLGHATGRSVWVAPVNRYRLELWSWSGDKLRALERQTAFFQPWSRYDAAEPYRKPPRPQMGSIHQSGDVLWVIVWIADAAWEPFSGLVGEVGVSNVGDVSRFWDTRIEAIDVRSNTLISSRTISARLSQFEGPEGLVHTYNEDVEGNVSVDIWKPVLVER